MRTGNKISEGRYGQSLKDFLTKEFLIEHYINNKETPTQISKIVRCHVRQIYTYIDYYEIEHIDHTGKIEPGQKFNMLTTIEIVGKSKNNTFIWLCKCDCGNETKVPTCALKNNGTKSCGCYRKEILEKSRHYFGPGNKVRWKGYCDISGNRISEIRCRARKHNMEFDLDAKFLWELLVSQNHKCAISGLDIKVDLNASVDRIDSKKGYTKDNVWWTHTDVNKMKMDIHIDKFLEYCEIIVNNKKSKNV